MGTDFTPRLILGDCVEAMTALEPESVDAVVCDPPYGIGFMGHQWDQPGEFGPVSAGHGGCNVSYGGAPHPAMEAGRYDLSSTANRRFQAWVEQWGVEILRVLKPGGHALVFGGTRTYHRLGAGLEDAGFEIRDCLAWMFGSGFPKSMDVSKAIDKSLGAEREFVGEGRWSAVRGTSRGATQGATNGGTQGGYNLGAAPPETAPATDEAAAWDGWGTALKPAFEPIVVARKPLTGTVAANVLAHGTGALNIDACRIEAHDDQLAAKYASVQGTGPRTNSIYGSDDRDRDGAAPHELGRWPANVILDPEAGAILDEQTGVSVSRVGKPRTGQSGDGWGMSATGAEYDDMGGASRFFYCAKVSRAERSAGLEADAASVWTDGRKVAADNPRLRGATARANHHPTVKPIDLMRYLIRLVTPLGGTVLDPFMGSGSTGCAAVLEGARFIGIEREQDYMAVAEARVAFWAEHGEDALAVMYAREAAEREKESVVESGQMDLWDVLG